MQPFHQYTPSESGLISIVLPCYNEEEAVEKVVGDIRAVMDQITDWKYEVLVVDDCSTDSTVAIVEKMPNVRLVRHRQNQGSGASRRTGIINAKGEIIIMLDADGTYEPKTIPKMLKYFPDYDQVNGARTSEKGTLKLLRTPAKWVLRQLAIFISGHHIPDLNTGLKAFKRDVMLKYLWVMPDGFSCVTSMTLAFLANGHPVKYVPTPYYKRIGVSKFHPIVDSSKYFITILRMMTFYKPLRVYMPIAGFMILLGILNGFYNLFLSDAHTLQESDIILICVGMLLGGIGLLAELIVSQRKA
ncbi:MAG: glycosyltransferase family 2 protein [Candidatus Sumerlaeia bacterium]|nr:glycosyltransferase family 2 protein [Candidatus Sumerlaeia bacterium]